jgi:hypothetical protein
MAWWPGFVVIEVRDPRLRASLAADLRKHMVGPVGLEPTTYGLKEQSGRCASPLRCRLHHLGLLIRPSEACRQYVVIVGVVCHTRATRLPGVVSAFNFEQRIVSLGTARTLGHVLTSLRVTQLRAATCVPPSPGYWHANGPMRSDRPNQALALSAAAHWHVGRD